jgi:hypothetical protein
MSFSPPTSLILSSFRGSFSHGVFLFFSIAASTLSVFSFQAFQNDTPSLFLPASGQGRLDAL